jgi:hypothetical protein
MNEALVQNPENDVDHQHCHDQQHTQSSERRLERLRRSLKACGDRRRKIRARESFYFGDSVTQRQFTSTLPRPTIPVM